MVLTEKELQVAGQKGFWMFVYTRRAHDNPRGDFIRDTQSLVDLGKSADDIRGHLLHYGCDRAQREFARLTRQYSRNSS